MEIVTDVGLVPDNVKLETVIVTVVGIDQDGKTFTAVTYLGGPFKDHKYTEESPEYETRRYTYTFTRDSDAK